MKLALKYMFHCVLSSYLARSKVYILNLNTSPSKFLFLNKVLMSRFIWHFIISFCFSKMPEECIVIKQKWKYKNEIFNINPILHFKDSKLEISSYLYLSLVKKKKDLISIWRCWLEMITWNLYNSFILNDWAELFSKESYFPIYWNNGWL